jgi:hypothetical protein
MQLGFNGSHAGFAFGHLAVSSAHLLWPAAQRVSHKPVVSWNEACGMLCQRGKKSDVKVINFTVEQSAKQLTEKEV